MTTTATRERAAILRAIRATVAHTDEQWSSLIAIREESGLLRADFDQAMTELAIAGEVTLVPEENQKMRTAAMDRNGLYLGGEVKHYVAIA